MCLIIGILMDGQIERIKILTWSPMVCEIDEDAILGAALQRQSFQYHTQMVLCCS